MPGRKLSFSVPYSGNVSWKQSVAAGGKFPGVRPIFSRDQKHLIVLTSLNLKKFQLATKQCVQSIPLDSMNVSDIFEDDQQRIWVSYKTGDKLLVVDSSLTNKVASINVKLSIQKIIAIKGEEGDKQKEDVTMLCIVKHHNSETQLVKLKVQVSESTASSPTLLLTNKHVGQFAISNNGEHYAFACSSHKQDDLVIGSLTSELEPEALDASQKRIKWSKKITSLAVSDHGIVAVGSRSGVIDLYYHNDNDGDVPVIRTLRWHVDVVQSLAFSLGSDYLLSGGKERVLVFWQLETGNTQFLPRLDGDIQSIYVDPTCQFYALILQGEQVLVLSAVDLESRLQVSGVKADFVKTFGEKKDQQKKKKKKREQLEVVSSSNNVPLEKVGDYTCAYHIHPITKEAYFPTKTMSQIQIYDVAKDEQTKVISVAPTLQTGKVRSESLIEDPLVTCVNFSLCGQWMATVDKRKNPPIDTLISKDELEINLKFWKFNKSQNSWTLSTRVSNPHGPNKQILDVIPTAQGMFLTASEDGSVRLWGPSKSKTTAGTVPKWYIKKILTTRGNTSPAVAIAASDDMSVIVLGFETSLYIIDGKRFELAGTIPSILGSRVRSLKIMGNHLVALSKTRLLVWDLLNMRQSWSVEVQAPTNGKRLIDYDPATNTILFAYNYYTRDFRLSSKLLFFSLTSPLPIHAESYHTAVSAVRLVPGNSSTFSFVDIKGRITTLLFGSKHKATAATTTNNALISNEPEEQFQAGVLALYGSKGSQMAKKNMASSSAPMESVILDIPTQNRLLSITSFESAFENPEASLESMFESVLTIVNPKP